MSLTFLVFAPLAGHTFASIAMTVVPAVAPAMARDYDVDPSLIGCQIACVSLGRVLCLANIYALTHSYGLSFASLAVPAIFAICWLMRLGAVRSFTNYDRMPT